MTIIMLSAITRIERKGATSFVFETVNSLGGWIDDVHMYSNLMNVIRFTLPADAFASLITALEEGGITVEPATTPSPGRDPQRDVMATLQITFLHDDPDLRRDVPPVPG